MSIIDDLRNIDQILKEDLQERCDELLAANNSEMEKRRAAEALLKAERARRELYQRQWEETQILLAEIKSMIPWPATTPADISLGFHDIHYRWTKLAEFVRQNYDTLPTEIRETLPKLSIDDKTKVQ